MNLGPVLTEKQKVTKAKLAELDDLLQEETTLLRKLQSLMHNKEGRVSKLRSKAAIMKKDSESNSHSCSFDIAWGLTEEELKEEKKNGSCCAKNKKSGRMRLVNTALSKRR